MLIYFNLLGEYNTTILIDIQTFHINRVSEQAIMLIVY